MRKLLIASTNNGKIVEIKNLFQDFNLDIIGLADYPDLDDVIEDGETFMDNALKKARVRAKETGELTLADDSGLVVDCLEGKPGVHSARFAGEDATDAENNQKLLQEMDGIPVKDRQARFICVIALVDPEKELELTVEGICEGIITKEPYGNNGFGYDPLFLVPDYNKTMAQLPLDVKNQISHRAKALKKIKEHIKDKYNE